MSKRGFRPAQSDILISMLMILLWVPARTTAQSTAQTPGQKLARSDAKTPATVFMDCIPTTQNPSDLHQELIVRELPRQALLIQMQTELARPCIVRDATVEPAIVLREGETEIGVERTVETGEQWKLHLHLLRPKNVELQQTALRIAWDSAGNVDASSLGGLVAIRVHTALLNTVAKLLSTTIKIRTIQQHPTTNSALDVPPTVEDDLQLIDFHHAFMAARLTHAAIAASGESPKRYNALARAYANLGEATRHLFNGQSAAFFARAFIYADYGVDLGDTATENWATHAYIDALYCMPQHAADDLLSVDKLAAESHTAIPKFVDLIRPLINFDTATLTAKAQQDNSALASYFAFLTAEHSMLPSVTINYAQAALARTPGAVRLEAAISDSSGIILQHQTTGESPRMLNRLVSLLANDADDPVVRDAAAKATQAQFSQSAILDLLHVLESRPAEVGQPLPWSTYAAIVRECEFLDAVRRIYFIAYAYGVDPGDEIKLWWPLIKDHRYAALIAAIPARNAQPDPDLLQKAAQIHYQDDVYHTSQINNLISALGLDAEGAVFTRQYHQIDGNAWDRGRTICEKVADPAANEYLSSESTLLKAIAPKHPLAIALNAVFHWDDFASHADEVRKSMGNNPTVAYGMALGYQRHNRVDDSIALLQTVVKAAPDFMPYEALANAYLMKKDEKKSIATWDDYIANGNDYALDRSHAGQTVAEYLNAQKQFQRALPYAKIAGDCYSSWGLEIYADTLANVHQYDQAVQVFDGSYQRYGDPTSAYRFDVTLNRGNRAAMAKACMDWYANPAMQQNSDQKLEYAVFLQLEGQTVKADIPLQVSFDESPGRATAMMLACRAIEQKNEGLIAATLNRTQANPRNTHGDQMMDMCVSEFWRCSKDPAAVPDRNGKLVASFADDDSEKPQVTCGYFLGRLCELRQKPDDARWWYRKACEPPFYDYTFRPLAAEGLRRLGEDYYK